MRVAVVIPALDEAVSLERLLKRLFAEPGVVNPADVFVAASGSKDETAEVARRFGCTALTTGQNDGRGSALREGVERALNSELTPEVVWMLHADCVPPADALALIKRALKAPCVVGGAFEHRFFMTNCSWWTRRQLRLVVFLNRLRYRCTGIYFGDQGLFARVEALEAIGGVPDWPVFEDVELSRRLRSRGKLLLLPERISTSPRRFVANGTLRQLFRDAWMLARHRLRGDGHRFAEAYARQRG